MHNMYNNLVKAHTQLLHAKLNFIDSNHVYNTPELQNELNDVLNRFNIVIDKLKPNYDFILNLKI